MKYSGFVLPAFAISLAILSCGRHAQPVRELISDRPAIKFEEAYPLGNGRMGAMIYGGLKTERIALNEETLWAGGPVDAKMNPDAFTHLPGIREALFAENYALADRLIRRLQGSYSQSYAPLGDLIIEYKDSSEARDYSRALDLRNGIARVSYTKQGHTVEREYFISHPDQLMLIRISSPGLPQSFSISAASKLPFRVSAENGTLLMNGIAPSHAEPNYRGETANAIVYDTANCMRFQMRLQVLHTDGEITATAKRTTIGKATETCILVSLATSYNGHNRNPGIHGADEQARNIEYLEAVLGSDYKKLRSRHISDFNTLFDRMSIQLGEPSSAKNTLQRLHDYQAGSKDNDLIALYFQYGRYLLISSSRPGGIPAHLQGIWNEHLRPPWSSNYTTNINAEMNYWPAEVCNLSELHTPLLDFIGRLAEGGSITAQTYYNCRGWCCHHNTDIWAMTNPVGDFGQGHPVWANWNMGGTWLSAHLWEHFLFTCDTAYLLDQAWPLMKGAALFCMDYLREAPDGYLVTAPSTSPENLYLNHDAYTGACLYGSTSDIAMIRELLNNSRTAAGIAGEVKMQEQIDSIIDRLPPYRIGRLGNLQEWYHDWDDQDPHHRHLSHLFGLYPGHSISTEADTALTAACRRSLELRTNKGTGWSIAWKISLWARLGDGEMALDAIKKLLRPDEADPHTKYHGGGTYPNLLDAHPPFQIDGNFGGTAGIAEMLLQSHPGHIILLPALPAEWPEGDIRGLRARGGYTVDISWKDHRLTEARINPDNNGEFRISYAGEQKRITGKKGRSSLIRF